MAWKFLDNLIEIKKDEKEKPVAPAQVSSPIFSKVSHSTTKPLPVVSGKYVATFERFMKEENDRNHPGHDYYEFSEMVKRMSMIADEKSRFQASLAAVGIDKTTLIGSSSKYTAAIDKEMDIFEKEYQEAYKESVGAKQKRCDEILAELQKLEAERVQLSKEIEDSMREIDSERDEFMAAGEDRKQLIMSEIEKINQYL